MQNELEAQLRRSNQLEEEIQKTLKTRKTSGKRRPERSTTRGDMSSSNVIDGSKSTEYMKKKSSGEEIPRSRKSKHKQKHKGKEKAGETQAKTMYIEGLSAGSDGMKHITEPTNGLPTMMIIESGKMPAVIKEENAEHLVSLEPVPKSSRQAGTVSPHSPRSIDEVADHPVEYPPKNAA